MRDISLHQRSWLLCVTGRFLAVFPANSTQKIYIERQESVKESLIASEECLEALKRSEQLIKFNIKFYISRCGISCSINWFHRAGEFRISIRLIYLSKTIRKISQHSKVQYTNDKKAILLERLFFLKCKLNSFI